MARPKLPRVPCIFCGKSLSDPRLDSPSNFGRHATYHQRCYNKARAKQLKAKADAQRAWRNIPDGCRVEAKDYKHTNGKGAGGHVRRRHERVGRYLSRQVCACGKAYIGGAAAVRCPLCQAEHARKLKQAWAAKNRARQAEHMAAHMERRRTVMSALAALAWMKSWMSPRLSA